MAVDVKFSFSSLLITDSTYKNLQFKPNNLNAVI